MGRIVLASQEVGLVKLAAKRSRGKGVDEPGTDCPCNQNLIKEASEMLGCWDVEISVFDSSITFPPTLSSADSDLYIDL